MVVRGEGWAEEGAACSFPTAIIRPQPISYCCQQHPGAELFSCREQKPQTREKPCGLLSQQWSENNDTRTLCSSQPFPSLVSQRLITSSSMEFRVTLLTSVPRKRVRLTSKVVAAATLINILRQPRCPYVRPTLHGRVSIVPSDIQMKE